MGTVRVAQRVSLKLEPQLPVLFDISTENIVRDDSLQLKHTAACRTVTFAPAPARG